MTIKTAMGIGVNSVCFYLFLCRQLRSGGGIWTVKTRSHSHLEVWSEGMPHPVAWAASGHDLSVQGVAGLAACLGVCIGTEIDSRGTCWTANPGHWGGSCWWLCFRDTSPRSASSFAGFLSKELKGNLVCQCMISLFLTVNLQNDGNRDLLILSF